MIHKVHLHVISTENLLKILSTPKKEDCLKLPSKERTVQVCIYMNEHEYEHVRKHCDLWGVSTSQMVLDAFNFWVENGRKLVL